MGEVGAVDDDERVRSRRDDRRGRPPDAPDERGQARQHRQDSHDGDVADREQALQPFGLHRLAADADKDDVGVDLAQRAHELEAELIARMLARDNRDP